MMNAKCQADLSGVVCVIDFGKLLGVFIFLSSDYVKTCTLGVSQMAIKCICMIQPCLLTMYSSIDSMHINLSALFI